MALKLDGSNHLKGSFLLDSNSTIGNDGMSVRFELVAIHKGCGVLAGVVVP